MRDEGCGVGVDVSVSLCHFAANTRKRDFQKFGICR